MPKFLIDENLSPLLGDYLRERKYDAKTVREVGLKGKSDEEIIRWIQKYKRILITADLGFGEIFYLKTFGKIGVVILRSRSQKLKSFQRLIDYLEREGVLQNKKLEETLVIATQRGYRIRKYIR